MLLLLLLLSAYAVALGSAHKPLEAPKPAFSYRQVTRADLLRQQTVKESRRLAPRARVSGTLYPDCDSAGTNVNGIFSLVSNTMLPSWSYGDAAYGFVSNSRKRVVMQQSVLTDPLTGRLQYSRENSNGLGECINRCAGQSREERCPL